MIKSPVEMLVAQINRNGRGVPEAPSRTLVESLGGMATHCHREVDGGVFCSHL